MGKQTVIFASTNKGKFEEFQRLMKLDLHDFKLISLNDLGYDIPDCEETGDTFQENALLKVEHTYKHLKSKHKRSIIIGDDSGMSIKTLGGEPGVHTRRWVGRVMTDDEIVSHCLEQLRGKNDRTADYVTAYAILAPNITEPRIIEHYTRGSILEELRVESYTPGIPFRGLFYIPEVDKMFHDARELPEAKRRNLHIGHETAIQECRAFVEIVTQLAYLGEVLKESWTASTSYWSNEWRQYKPSLGQCAVSALLIQDILGGQLIRCNAQYGDNSRAHFYNLLSGNVEVDFTRDQFPEEAVFTDDRVADRSDVLSHPDTTIRYEELKRNFYKSFNKDRLWTNKKSRVAEVRAKHMS